MRRAYVAVAATVALFLLVQLGALALVDPFMAAGYQTVEDPGDPTNSVVYLLAILGITGVMLVAMRFGVDRILQALVLFAAVFITFYVFSVVVPPVGVVEVAGWGVHLPAVAAAVVLGVGLLVYPEWYVIDAAGVVMGAGAAGLFGISFGLLPALVLLVVLAVYDAISVYGTEHMLTLASGVMDLRLPVVLVVPLTLSYSFLDEEGPAALEDATAESAADGDGASPPSDVGGPAADAPDPEALERDALFIGLGDAVVPAILVASAAFFRPGNAAVLDVPGIAVTVPALGAMLGTLTALLVLMALVLRGRPHAGLPLLNGGAILGYLAGAMLAGITLVEAVGVAPYL